MSSNNPNLPNIDQRLEALVQSVEPMARMMQDNERRSEERLNRIDGRIDRMLDGIEKLTHVAESHERRLNSLEQ